ncbi:hypothetical protein [Gordonia sp. NPDC003429]
MGDDTTAMTRVLDASVVERARNLLRRRGTDLHTSFALVVVTDAGVDVAVVDAADGVVIDERRVPGTAAAELDELVAEHLVQVGRVQTPENDEWWSELRSLAERGRARLVESDGTFIMGQQHVRLFRVTRRDLADATRDVAEGLPSFAEQMAHDHGRDLDALVLAESHPCWPGLPAVLAPVTAVPIVVLDGVIPIDVSPEPEPVPVAADDVPPVEVAPDESLLDESLDCDVAPAGPPSADLEIAPDRPDENALEVTDRIEPVAVPTLAYSAVPATPAGPQQVSSPRGSRIRTKVLVGVIGAGVLAAGATATAVAVTGHSASPTVMASPSQKPSTTTLYADLADLAEAGRPAATYVPPPPPPPPPPAATSDRRPAPPAPAPRPRPRPRVVIPIPGLPPIVVP